jgi:divalent metal cation (Fe/Co/Zn/Cd) transporter
MNCHDILSRGIIGRQVFIEMQMIVEASDVETDHKITEEVEKRLEARVNPVGVLIDIEPPDYKSEKISFDEGNKIK